MNFELVFVVNQKDHKNCRIQLLVTGCCNLLRKLKQNRKNWW